MVMKNKKFSQIKFTGKKSKQKQRLQRSPNTATNQENISKSLFSNAFDNKCNQFDETPYFYVEPSMI